MSDTIIAISTPLGEGGIGIVRLSGPACLDIMRAVYKECPDIVTARHTYYGHYVNYSSQIIDEAIFIYMNAPFSYTGEDMLEIQAHGSNVVLKDIVRYSLEYGRILKKNDNSINLRLAEPGEFTKLAFVNGKMDLSQAEAVIDIIKSRTELSLGIAELQRQGRLSDSVNSYRSELRDILAQMTVNIDYPDEDIEQESYDDYIEKLRFIMASIEELLNTSSIGRIAREGIRVAIVGKPNVGKSSLMNVLLGEGRAIVTDIPGTTRDTLEESANIDGIPIVLVDTAGIHETDDIVEKLGIERSSMALNSAQLIILVIDGSNKLDKEDYAVIQEIKNNGKSKLIVVLNKEDAGNEISSDDIGKLMPNAHIITTSLVGLGSLEAARRVSDTILKIFNMSSSISEGNIISNERHINCLQNAYDNIEQAMYMLEEGEPLELAELNVHYAYNELGNIIGEAVGEEILDTVFSKFCLGK